jgi:hypothetical protein
LFDWLKRRQDFFGSAFFPGRLLPPAERYLARFVDAGIGVVPRHPERSERWRAELRHPQWGTADAVAYGDSRPPPSDLFDFAFISSEERALARTAGCGIGVQVKCRSDNLLRDRKLALRFLRAALSSDGVVAIDEVAQKVVGHGAFKPDFLQRRSYRCSFKQSDPYRNGLISINRF